MRAGVRIGVDVGEARVGVARSDPAGLLATPVRTLERDRGGASDLTTLAALVAEYEAIEVIVGLPIGLDGNSGLAASRAREYAALLHQRLSGVSIRLVDERLTTVDAHRALHDSGVRSRNHRAVVDQAAAVVILQNALDTERGTGKPAGRRLGERKPRSARPGHGSEGRQR